MQPDNNTTRIRRDLMVKLARQFFEGTLLEGIDRLPLEMRPRDYRGQRLRCCIHTERAILRYRLMALMGFNIGDETDELKPLSEYAREAMTREKRDTRMLTVIDDACSACVKSRYFVTNACQGCMARSCVLNCPKKAITFEGGQSKIDSEACVNCGRCVDMCPFHAIVRVPVPCEEACPVGAITRGETGKQALDHESCVHCGKCMQACPFGAIAEQSEFLEILRVLGTSVSTVAMFAPALLGQFEASPEQLVGALKALGFTHVVEVAAGADRTTVAEAEELVERLEAGDPFMTTSCCPAYTDLARKTLPGLAPRISHTPTPMHFTAEMAAARFPAALRIFISPCVAKRREALLDPLVDSVITFEELGAAFVAKGIEVAHCGPASPDLGATSDGRGYAMEGGVRDAVARRIGERTVLRPERLSGLGKEMLRQLKVYGAGKGTGNFVECMSCEGGCINGPCVVANPRVSRRKLEAVLKETPAEG